MPMTIKQLMLPVDSFNIEGELNLPSCAHSVIIFSYGNGGESSDRRIRAIADQFHKEGLGTLTARLLTEAEAMYQTDFDLLTRRLIALTLWIYSHSSYGRLNLAYFSAGYGAMPAIKAAVVLKPLIKALVVHSANPLALRSELAGIECPTLFVAGEFNFQSVQLNKRALTYLTCPKQLAIIPAASYYFEEPGKREQLIKISAAWFRKHLAADHSH